VSDLHGAFVKADRKKAMDDFRGGKIRVLIASDIAARGLDLSTLVFSANFGRNLDYYTGFVFEAHRPDGEAGRPVIGGGRYDGLLRRLGASQDIPAVGAAIWCDRLFAGGDKA
jgi:ATP phosphoribosyltransferase regulatory subunit